MFDIVKYEFNGKSKIIATFISIYMLLNIFFIVKGSYNGNTGIPGLYVVLVVLTTFAAIIAVLIDCISLFRRDLYEDSAYLIFSLPESGYSILGSKFIIVLIQFIGLFLVGSLVIFISILFNFPLSEASVLGNTLSRNEYIKTVISKISFNDILMYVKWFLYYITIILELFSVIFFSITLTKTLFRGKKFARLLAFVVFVLINIIVTKIGNFLDKLTSSISGGGFDFSVSQNSFSFNSSGISIGIASLVFEIIIASVLFIVTSKLLERKMDI